MDEIKSPLKAIKQFCFECVGESRKDVKTCTAPRCPLYQFRLGKNPFIKKREYTTEQLEQMRERMKNLNR